MLERRVDVTSRFSLAEVEALVCQEIGVAGLGRAGGVSSPSSSPVGFLLAMSVLWLSARLCSPTGSGA